MSSNRNRRPHNGASRQRVVAGTPLVTIDTDEDGFDEVEPLFTIGGKQHTVLVRVPAGAALQYLGIQAQRGQDAATIFALQYALGAEGYLALCRSKGLTAEHLRRITEAVTAKFDGALVPKASANGQPRSAG